MSKKRKFTSLEQS